MARRKGPTMRTTGSRTAQRRRVNADRCLHVPDEQRKPARCPNCTEFSEHAESVVRLLRELAQAQVAQMSFETERGKLLARTRTLECDLVQARELFSTRTKRVDELKRDLEHAKQGARNIYAAFADMVSHLNHVELVLLQILDNRFGMVKPEPEPRATPDVEFSLPETLAETARHVSQNVEVCRA